MAVTNKASFAGADGRVGDDAPVLRPLSVLRPSVIAIAASTGGPEALTSFFSKLGAFDLPVLVALHMGEAFAEMIVAGIRRRTEINAHLACNMETLLPGRVYFAPADSHLSVQRAGGGVVTLITKASPACKYKPSADRLFDSAARVYGARTLGIVFSGMGDDGCAGSRTIAAAGGSVLVQDRASSAVWGMPGAVLSRSLASAAMDPPGMGKFVSFSLLGQRVRPAP